MRATGRATVSTTNPRAFAICDRCGFLYNHYRLNWQYDWAGPQVINKKILVCDPCMDKMQEQLRTIVLPIDPPPIMNSRTQNYVAAETDYRVTEDGRMLVTEDENNRTVQETGAPPYSLNEEPGTDPNAPGNDDPGLPYGYDEVPKTGPLE